MQAASLSRPEEVTMFTRRIVACACALALAVPAAAAARPGFDPPPSTQQHVVYGDTKYDLQNTQELGPKGDTKDDLAPAIAKRHVVVPAGKAGGRIVVLHHASASGSSSDIDGWRLAALLEAGLLASIAVGGAALVGRARPQRGATA
jgi:hypothetical protein